MDDVNTISHTAMPAHAFGPHRRALSHGWTALGVGLLLCVILFVPLRVGHAEDLPTNICFGQFCGPAQQGIWNRFEGGTGLNLLLVPSVYSGTCYHNSPAYNPHTPQFGGVLIDASEGRVVFDGRFSFYEQQHPYTHLSVGAARKLFQEARELALFDTFAYAEAENSLKPFRYWLRQDADNDSLLLIGYFGYNHTILCALDRNEY
jgi:hypothetical protein